VGCQGCKASHLISVASKKLKHVQRIIKPSVMCNKPFNLPPRLQPHGLIERLKPTVDINSRNKKETEHL